MDSPSQSEAEIPTIFDPTTCTRKGLCPVTLIRKQGEPFESHSLYFEQHGSGPEKIAFIMGLNSSSFSWYAQVQHFGRKPEYSILVFDNRGVGNSGTPRGPYTTSGMAEDVIVLLDYVGWTDKRDLHVVGASLGGMIAQELVTRIPDRVVSLTLAVTRASGRSLSSLPTPKGVITLARLLAIKDPEVKIPMILDMLYPREYLDAPAPNDPEGRTNEEIQTAGYRRRIAATRPQKLMGALSQMVAPMTHHVSPERLRNISATIPKVLILTGDQDNLVNPAHSLYLKEHMPEAELVVWEGTGHGILGQHTDRLNELFERVFREGRERLAEQQQDATENA
ncbi:alpha/beta-hydrolase [Sparassis latifolia]